jgi:hypothetical protein
LRRRQTTDVSGPFFAMGVPAFAAKSEAKIPLLIQYISGGRQAVSAALLGIRRRFDQRGVDV